MKGADDSGLITAKLVLPIAVLVVLVIVTVVSLALSAGGDKAVDPRPDRDRTTSEDVDVPDREAEPEPSTQDEPGRRSKWQKPPSNQAATAEPEQPPRRRTFLVTDVVDGDTIDLANGERVRLVGIDTPEVGDCHSRTATARVEQLVLGKRVRLGRSDEDRDGYDRLLRYVDIGDTDVGLGLIREGLAIARYDSRDGYGFHPREPRYVAADQRRPLRTCAHQPQPFAEQPSAQASSDGACADGYSPCVSPYPPDLDCADVDGPIQVTGSDPHGFDRDGDGVACEWG